MSIKNNFLCYQSHFALAVEPEMVILNCDSDSNRMDRKQEDS